MSRPEVSKNRYEMHELVNRSELNQRIYFGTPKDEPGVYLSAPEWDCGWYWGWGYLGNKDCHFHVESFFKQTRQNAWDYLKENYKLSKKIEENLWVVLELFKSFYTASEYAHFLYTGGAHYTKNPCEATIRNDKEYQRINEEVIPAIIKEFYRIAS